jgi:hypothetical protein
MLCFNFTIAQITITGNVVDDLGVPLPGATILEVGTSNGTTTDFDGNYSITVEDNASISASFVGYESFTVAVAGQDQINFSLEQGNQLEEVIVTSLGINKPWDMLCQKFQMMLLNSVRRVILAEYLQEKLLGYKLQIKVDYLDLVLA